MFESTLCDCYIHGVPLIHGIKDARERKCFPAAATLLDLGVNKYYTNWFGYESTQNLCVIRNSGSHFHEYVMMEMTIAINRLGFV